MVRPLLPAVLLAAVLVTGCSEDRRFPTAEDLPEVDFTPDHVVTVDAGGFEPDELTVRSGEVVLLVNEGDGRHSFSAEKRLETGPMEPGEETVVVLEAPGEIEYVDQAGGTGNEGRIVVEADGT